VLTCVTTKTAALGLELHVLKNHVEPARLEFLPYHFLLASVGKTGHLNYQDTSTGRVPCWLPVLRVWSVLVSVPQSMHADANACTDADVCVPFTCACVGRVWDLLLGVSCA
jgi:hypothetical protein